MKLIKPKFEIWPQPAGLEGVYKQIEKAGRVCYKSEDKITEDSAKSFVDRMIKSGHGAMLEHGTVYLAIPYDYVDVSCKLEIPIVSDVVEEYKRSPHTEWHMRDDGFSRLAFITTNYRVLVENNWLDDLKYLCEPTEYHAKRITVHFVCDRGVSHEFVRHRVMSFAQESTRYCNYSKDKFGNELTFIIPCWLDIPEDTYSLGRLRSKDDPERTCMVEISENNGAYNVESPIGKFLHVLDYSSDRYMELVNEGWKPQQARAVLPNSLKTELVMTGFADDWWGEYLVIDKATGLIDQRIHGKFYDELNNIDRDKYRVVEKGFFPLRCSSGAHPQAQELAIPLRQEFINKKIW